MKISYRVGLSVLGLAGLMAGGAADAAALQCSHEAPAAERLLAINAVQNLMGRYATDFPEGGLKAVTSLFALDDPTVSWKVPQGPSGPALKEFMEKVASAPPGPSNPWGLYLHSMFSPVIEVAADGKTAMGVWDSFGPVIGGPGKDEWDWLKYGVDFINVNGEWKIWHLQVFPVFTTPYNRGPSETALVNSTKKEDAALMDTGDRKGWTGPKDPLWIYDGKTSLRGPKTPRPYCTYEASLSAAQYARF